MNKKVGIVLSGAALALGILAVPVLAGTDSQTKAQANVLPINVKSQNIRTVADTPEIPVTPEMPSTPATPANPDNPANSNNQTGCGSISAEAMQSMHNSSVMQDAMNSPDIKAQLGDDVVNSMNQMMSDVNINAMHSTQGVNKTGSGSRNMMNWQ